MTATVVRPPAVDDQAWHDVAAVLAQTGWDRRAELDAAARDRMTASRAALGGIARHRAVYGLTSGFGPLVGYPADGDPFRQGAGLIHHLAVGSGAPLPPDVTRTMVWLRLRGMTLGHSAADPAVWRALADQWNHGVTPVVPREGSLSASGDLVPLAHAAHVATGEGQVWRPDGIREPAAEALPRHGLAPVRWDARSALAFVNGTSASLALALHNHLQLAGLARAAAAVTGRLARLLGCSTEPYADAVAAVRPHPGQRVAAAWIRSAIGPGARRTAHRPLQEPYSLRCAPQVVGAVLDQLRLQSEVLSAEAAACTDNPVLVDGEVLHAGNFHAAPVGHASEQQAICVHQLAYLMERQLALVLDPGHNGGLPPLLTPSPGRCSGLAGVQLAATAQLAAIRQHGLPASFTAVPTNLGNQDHVPLALNSANAVVGMLDRSWRIAASLLLAVHQLAHLTGAAAAGGGDPTGPLWAWLAAEIPPLTADRPLSGEIAQIAAIAERQFIPRTGTADQMAS